MFYITYKIISRGFASLRLEEVTICQAVQPEPLPSRVARVVKIYTALMPFLTALAGIPLIPPTWRAGLIAFLQALDLLAAAPISPVAPAPLQVPELAAVDTTTTDPTSTVPSFKAGKDL
jgi:hypothetical protein